MAQWRVLSENLQQEDDIWWKMKMGLKVEPLGPDTSMAW